MILTFLALVLILDGPPVRHQVHSSGELQRVLRKETEAERKIIRKPSETHVEVRRPARKRGVFVPSCAQETQEKKHSSSGSRQETCKICDQGRPRRYAVALKGSLLSPLALRPQFLELQTGRVL